MRRVQHIMSCLQVPAVQVSNHRNHLHLSSSLCTAPLSTSANATRNGFYHTDTHNNNKQVVIIGGTRTPIGSFQSSLSTIPATLLGSHVIKATIDSLSGKVAGGDINEVIFGNVCSAGLGQAPSSQAAIRGGIPPTVPTTTVNKVCSSGLKSVMFGTASIIDGTNEIVMCGGMENMSAVPHYLMKARTGYSLGHGQLVDGLINDGLWDAFDNHHMGNAAELTAKQYNITRQQQDAYCIQSYERALYAQQQGYFKSEITPIQVKDKKSTTLISDDEEPQRLLRDKIPTLKGAFVADGTVTAANSSKLNDGAAAILISSLSYAEQHHITPLFRILSYADAQRKPVEFTIAPSDAIPLAIKRAGLTKEDIDYYEINEAFSAVALANIQILSLDMNKVNVFGGSVALGHPLGASGARILLTLMNVLNVKKGRIGVAAICNGGGGASAMVIERMG